MCLGLMMEILDQWRCFFLFVVTTKHIIQNVQKSVQVVHIKTEPINELAVIYCTV